MPLKLLAPAPDHHQRLMKDILIYSPPSHLRNSPALEAKASAQLLSHFRYGSHKECVSFTDVFILFRMTPLAGSK